MARVSSLEETCEKPQQGSPSSSKLHLGPGPDTPQPCPALGPAHPGTTPTPTLSHPVSGAAFPVWPRVCSGCWGWLGCCHPWSLFPAWPGSPHWGLWEGTGQRGRVLHHPGNPMAPASSLQSHIPRGAGTEMRKMVPCCSPERHLGHTGNKVKFLLTENHLFTVGSFKLANLFFPLAKLRQFCK